LSARVWWQPKAAKQGFWLHFNHSWDPRGVPIRNFQTVSEGFFSETQSLHTEFSDFAPAHITMSL
jgi:hypothetical protein